MLVHIGQAEAAEAAHNAWLTTVEEGIHTYDVYKDGVSRQQVGTSAFADAIIARLGKRPGTLKPVRYDGVAGGISVPDPTPTVPAAKETIGVDIFLCWRDGSPDDLARILDGLPKNGFNLSMITNRGVKVWPDGLPETFCTDHWRCRFMGKPGLAENIMQDDIVNLLGAVNGAGLDFIKIETLRNFDGSPGYSLGQGQ